MTELEKAVKKTYLQFKTAILWSGFTQSELAGMLDTSQAQISRAIHGAGDRKSVEIREKLVKILNMDVEEVN